MKQYTSIDSYRFGMETFVVLLKLNLVLLKLLLVFTQLALIKLG